LELEFVQRKIIGSFSCKSLCWNGNIASSLAKEYIG